MKKIAGIVLTLGTVAGTASAQSSVTMYGVMDLTARHTSNEGAGSINSVASGGNSTSKLGFRGIEDLGGGLSAGFWLESGIAADHGSIGLSPVGTFFDRRSTVSLISKRFGEVRAGRDLVTSYANWGRFDPFAYVGVASAANFVTASQTGPIRAAFSTSPNTTVRSSNSIQYLLPPGLYGFDGGIMAGLREEGTAASNQHRYVGVRLGYTLGRLYVSAATGNSENNLTLGQKFKDSAIAVKYELSAVKLSGGVRQFRFNDAKQVNLLLGAVVPVGVGEIKLSFNRANMSGTVGGRSIDANDATQIGLGYVHHLSKRTAIYTSFARISNKGGANFTVPGGPSGMRGGGTSRGIDVGLRNSF